MQIRAESADEGLQRKLFPVTLQWNMYTLKELKSHVSWNYYMLEIIGWEYAIME